MTDLALSPVPLTLTGQVNNLAKAELPKLGEAGAFGQSGQILVLDFGTLLQDGGIQTALFGLSNGIPSGEPADLLDVVFGLHAPDFLLTGFGPYSNVTPGQLLTGLSIGFGTAMALGSFDEFLTLERRGHNASGFSEDLAPIRIELRASIQAPGSNVPEPATLALVLAGMLLFAAMEIWRRMRVR